MEVNKTHTWGVPIAILLALMVGAWGGYHFTSVHYRAVESKQAVNDNKNLICEARLQHGHVGDVKSKYYIIERSAKQSDCPQFIDYKNIPDDTEMVWLGF